MKKINLFFIHFLILFLFSSCGHKLTKEDARAQIIESKKYPIPAIQAIPEGYPFDEFVRAGLYKEVQPDNSSFNQPYSSGLIPKVYVSVGPSYELTDKGREYVKGSYKGKPTFLLKYYVFGEIVSIEKVAGSDTYLSVSYTEIDSLVSPFGEILFKKSPTSLQTLNTARFYDTGEKWKFDR